MKKILFGLIPIFLFFPFFAEALTVNFVSDIHAGSSKYCEGDKCVPKWKSAFQEVLDKTEGMIITTGDNTDEGSKIYAEKLRNMTTEEEIYWANGNHDKHVYVGGKRHYIVKKGDWTIVIADYEKDCGKKEHPWLKSTLSRYKNDKVMVVMHIPVFKKGTTKIDKKCKKTEKIFDKYDVDYVFSGHWHSDHWTRKYHGITYVAIQGLTNGRETNYKVMEF